MSLLASEVATNVVQHAGPHFAGSEMVVVVSTTVGGVRVEVADGHPGVPVVGDGSLDGLSGRGVLLLDALASAWGVIPDSPGKVVWFEVSA